MPNRCSCCRLVSNTSLPLRSRSIVRACFRECRKARFMRFSTGDISPRACKHISGCTFFSDERGGVFRGIVCELAVLTRF